MQTSQMVTSNLRIDGERMHADFLQLSEIGATPDGGISRVALSPQDLAARAWFADRIEEAGLAVRDDDAGNLSGVLTSRQPNAKTLLIGSHLDSVPNGGRYDGAVGILAGLECLRTLRAAGVELPVHLEIINFTDDEGNWRSMFGCRALAGMLTADDLTDQHVDNAPFRAAMSRAGIDPRAIYRARRSPAKLAGYLELHIEQSARLHRAGINIGVVSGIVGRTTYLLTFTGQAGHSGTTDMYKRRDALRGAALFVVRGHDTVRERYGDGIFNVGDIEVEPGAFNVSPSRARLLMECRHVSEKQLAEMETTLLGIARECAAANGLEMESEHVVHVPAATMAAGVIQAIEQSADMLDLSHMRMFSYSGHSAQILSKLMPSGMIFIPSVDGIGHRPDEFTEWSDVINGANVLLQTILSVAGG
ncbi:MAG: Zn-dependent hydrolase [Anaerolineae bacterium]|nr:Zn-dependent hydrolase [Anaerolineae bacterium]